MSWYVRRDGDVSGPFTEAEVVKRIADGNINRQAMVRQDAATEWSLIENSIFAGAFGASNPYKDAALVTPRQSGSSSLFVWLAIAAVCVLVEVAVRGESGPARVGYTLGNLIGKVLGAVFLWGFVRWVWGLIRPARW